MTCSTYQSVRLIDVCKIKIKYVLYVTSVYLRSQLLTNPQITNAESSPAPVGYYTFKEAAVLCFHHWLLFYTSSFLFPSNARPCVSFSIWDVCLDRAHGPCGAFVCLRPLPLCYTDHSYILQRSQCFPKVSWTPASSQLTKWLGLVVAGFMGWHYLKSVQQ